MSWPSFWQTSSFSLSGWALRPLGALVCRVARQRLKRFRQTPPVSPAPCPVLVVGNLTVGGSGKTPFIQWLGQSLQQKGWRIGVISRGYGGQAEIWPQWVATESDPEQVGDEPVLLAQTLRCPVAVAPDRPQALQCLIDRAGVLDLIISDDGLQHFALARDLEVVVLDGARGLGNGRCLPAGPLREPASRLQSVDWVVSNGTPQPALQAAVRSHRFHDDRGAGGDVDAQLSLQPAFFYRVRRPQEQVSLATFAEASVQAVAGIGHPERFFQTLRPLVKALDASAFADHHAYRADDFKAFDPQKPLIMTAKDAVKCQTFAEDHWWALAVTPNCPQTLLDQIEHRLSDIKKQKRSSSKRETS
ncbi:MAG: tetraacyldisaccharide 4'-kinase [Hydrogenovibrio sp.]|uniref:tetraacyldisaccharide 4'-kinase n=1 Tax=Hydrogenovibrio sp. TaxID=2065821 RepID=UPI00286FBDCF|nr:tetraacyldisaccharide 4'-kinase [Hydrogenovibrio sp.]MDR9497965.1 tetraacyldisaccharide 4'-kinase [Hydrogenovibrio sp.]